MQLIFCSDSLGLSGLGVLICKTAVGAEGVCTGCSRVPFCSATLEEQRSPGSLVLLCPRVRQRKHCFPVMHGRAQRQSWNQKDQKVPTLTRSWLPGIQNGNNDDSYLQSHSKVGNRSTPLESTVGIQATTHTPAV